MNKIYLATLLTVGLSISAFAAQSTPISTTEKPWIEARYAGVSTCEISNSSSTNAVLCTTGNGIILQVIGSSIAATDFLTFRDSNTANTSSATLLHLTQGSTPIGGLVFPRFKNGLSVNASVAPPVGTGFWTIVYTKDLY